MSKCCIIGDIHGCLEEFKELDNLLLPEIKRILAGDLTDRGPDSNGVVEYAASRSMLLLNSNHDEKYINFIKKRRQSHTIENLERRAIYQSLSQISRDYLLTAKPYVRLEIRNNPEYNVAHVVHGGIGPHHNLYPLDGKSFNEILRLRHVDKVTLEKVSTIRRADGTVGPEHDNVEHWQNVYDGRYGLIIHGHSYFADKPTIWPTNVISIDTGVVYGGNLTAMILDLENGNYEFKQVKAKRKYSS